MLAHIVLINMESGRENIGHFGLNLGMKSIVIFIIQKCSRFIE